MSEPVVRSQSAVPLGLAALLACLSMISPFSIDTFFPSMRAMQAQFDISALSVQQTITAYFIPYAVMSLVHGPLSDALGRRLVVLWGLLLYTVASLACAVAPSFAALLLFRAIQGMTAGAGLTVGRAIIGDLYKGADAQRLMSVVTVMFSLAPAIAPVVGGYIHIFYSWRGVFFFLTFIGAALFFVCYRLLPETHPISKRVSLHFGTLSRNVCKILCNSKFLFLAMCSAMQFAAVMLYIGSAPAIILDTWELSETEFIYLFLPVISGFLLGAITSGKLAGHSDPRKLMLLGLLLTIMASLLGIVLNIFIMEPPRLTQQLVIFCTALGVQFVFPVVTIRVMALYPQWRGSVAAVQSFLQLAIASFMMGIVAPLLHGNLGYIACSSFFLALSALCFALFSEGQKALDGTT